MGGGWCISPYLVVLLEPGNHDDDAAPLLPHHVPEVPHSVNHRPLGGNVGPGSPSVTLQETDELRHLICTAAQETHYRDTECIHLSMKHLQKTYDDVVGQWLHTTDLQGVSTHQEEQWRTSNNCTLPFFFKGSQRKLF